MARPPKASPTPTDDNADETRLEQAGLAAQELTIIQREATETANALANQLGYDGSLTVGTIEDEIRFYQRRTVEACLELGKRLLLLKELTPYGEFQSRVELLGFSKMVANRFMNAATRTARSTNLVLLSTQVKSMSAFLELVTQDDGVIEHMAEMDAIDRMSASEIRALARSMKEDANARDKVIADLKQKDIDNQIKSRKKLVANTDWPDAYTPLIDQAAAAGRELAHAYGKLATIRLKAFENPPKEEDQEQFMQAAAHLADVMAQALERAGQLHAEELRLLELTLPSGE